MTAKWEGKMALFEIRQARVENTALILQMIRELAEFEQLLDQVVADEKTLGHSLFSDPNRLCPFFS